MKKTTIILILLSFSLIIIFSSCASPIRKNQLMFGIQAARQDLWDEAIFRWKRVIQIQPDSAAAHNNLAVAYEKKGMWNEAEEEYKIALKLSPGNGHIQSNYEKFKKHIEKKEKDDNEKKDKNKI